MLVDDPIVWMRAVSFSALTASMVTCRVPRWNDPDERWAGRR